jgi:hypothetical protein
LDRFHDNLLVSNNKEKSQAGKEAFWKRSLFCLMGDLDAL